MSESTAEETSVPVPAAPIPEQVTGEPVKLADESKQNQVEVDSNKEEERARADKLVAEGKKAIALKQWEEGVAKYADALSIMGRLVGDSNPAMAPLLLSYGKALYELAFSQSGVMGKDEVNKATKMIEAEPEAEAGPSGSKFVFEDAQFEGGEGDGNGEGDAEAEGEGEEESEVEGEGGDAAQADEPEDDFNAAWEVLDVARTIYQKIISNHPPGSGLEDRLNLSECYVALGDVSCETENFPQAVSDYTAALEIKKSILPPSSRALASVHYQLATALEFTPSGRAAALSHVESALAAFKARLAELDSAPTTTEETMATGAEPKTIASSDDVKSLSAKERQAERADVQALIGDLEVKIDELKAAPPTNDLVSESINHLLGGIGSVSSSGGEATAAGPVNDLTSMVRKKKKAEVVARAPASAPTPVVNEQETNGKRKAEEDVGAEEKKVKAE